MVSFRKTSSRSRIRRMPHSLTDTIITGGIVIMGEFNAVRRFKTLKFHLLLDLCPPHLRAIDANVVISVSGIP